ncbi:hypothetical protein ACH4M4_36245 [Streptomyces sp. NPDC017254]|uniref:hypothetical protein n=1 Tax=unclassified Streptomyces TaxID=2593676 RepID=UPI00378A6DF0
MEVEDEHGAAVGDPGAQGDQRLAVRLQVVLLGRVAPQRLGGEAQQGTDRAAEQPQRETGRAPADGGGIRP